MTDHADAAEQGVSPLRRLVLVGAGLLAVALVVGVIVTGGGSVSRPPVQLDAADARSADRAPGFAMVSLADDDVVIDLADHAASPVVVNFWASWCVPCRREMPAFEAVHRDYADRVTFIGVNHQDDRADALELVAETGVTYPSVYDPQGVIAYDYGLFGMPTTVFVDADGRIAGHHTGELTETDLRSTLDQLLAESS